MNTFPRVLVLATILSMTSARADDWPRWRGPRDDGTAGPGAYVASWSPDTNRLWTVELPGKGCSTPAVWGDRIYLTVPAEGKDAVLAFDRAGKRQWLTTLDEETPGRHKAGSGSNPSPVTDGRGVYVYFKSGTLAALEPNGRVRWKTNLQARYGRDNLFWDFGTSPVLTDKDVVIAVMRGGNSYLAAFDQASGELRWKVARDYEVSFEADHSYATPIRMTHAGRDVLMVWGAEHLTLHDTSDGRVVWSCGAFNPEKKSNWPPVASPVVVGDIAVVPYGRGMRLHGVRLAGEGDVTATARLWLRDDTGAYCPTPAARDGRVYIVTEKSRVECIDPPTGRTLWTLDLPPAGAKYYASPVIADGKLYVVREDGMAFVLRIDGEPALLSQQDLGEPVYASPVPVNGRLLFRGERHLICVGAR